MTDAIGAAIEGLNDKDFGNIATNGTLDTVVVQQAGATDDLTLGFLGAVPTTDPAALFEFAFVQSGTNTPVTMLSVDLRVIGLDDKGVSAKERVTVESLASNTQDVSSSYLDVSGGFILMNECTFESLVDGPPDVLGLTVTNVDTLYLEFSSSGDSGSPTARGIALDGDGDNGFTNPVTNPGCAASIPTLSEWVMIVLTLILVLVGARAVFRMRSMGPA